MYLGNFVKFGQNWLYLDSFRARGEGGAGGGGLQPPIFFGNFKELLRKRCFQPPHFESLISPPTFKVAPRAVSLVVFRKSGLYLGAQNGSI